MMKAVVGIVDTLGQADAVVHNLRIVGFGPFDISVVLPDAYGTKDFVHVHPTEAPAGGLMGGAIGLLAGIGMLALPGVGPLIGAGPVRATLSGTAGVTAGGITSALVRMGIPELGARLYEWNIRRGRVLVAVHTEDVELRSRAVTVFRAAGVREVSTVLERAIPAHGRAG